MVGGAVGHVMTDGVVGRSRAGIVIGIDIGTTNSKGVACRPDGTVVASARFEHGISTPQAGWFEHDAEEVWWSDTVRICRRLTAELEPDVAIRAIAVTTCGPCLVPVDGASRALRPGILYGVDTRAQDEIAAFQARIGSGAIEQLSRMPLSSQTVGPKIAWVLAKEPEVARRTATWHTATSYLVARLTGVSVIDHHQASFFAPFIDARRRAWDFRHAEGLELEGRLPALRWPGEVAGGVTADAAAATGLPVGTPVLVGTSDGPTEALAVGASRPGIVAATYGSTTTLTTFGPAGGAARGLWDSEGWSAERRCIGGGLSTSGAIVDWLRREFARELAETDGQAAADGPAAANGPVAEYAHEVLAREAAASPVGANGVLVLPWFGGERTPVADPLARGILVGLSLAHTRADIHRAVLEGIAFGVRHILEAFQDAGIPVDEVRAAGGGTLSPLGMQIVSDVTGHDQVIPRQTIGASYGAAYLAARTVGLVAPDEDLDDGDAWFEPARMVRPNADHAAAYDRRYALFRQVDRDTRALVHALAADALGGSA